MPLINYHLPSDFWSSICWSLQAPINCCRVTPSACRLLMAALSYRERKFAALDKLLGSEGVNAQDVLSTLTARRRAPATASGQPTSSLPSPHSSRSEGGASCSDRGQTSRDAEPGTGAGNSSNPVVSKSKVTAGNRGTPPPLLGGSSIPLWHLGSNLQIGCLVALETEGLFVRCRGGDAAVGICCVGAAEE